MPVVAVLVLDGAAVARALGKAARLGGIRVARLQRERPQRGIAHIDAVGIGVVLGGGAGVLQVVFAAVLCHKGALDVGLADGVKHLDQLFLVETAAGGQAFGQVQVACDRVDERLERAVDKALLLIGDLAVLAGALVAESVGVLKDQLPALADGLHRGGVHLDAVDGVGVAAAPVQVDPAVVVLEQVGVPEIKRGGHLLKCIAQRVFGAQDGAVFAPAGGAEIQIPVYLAHVRRVVVDHQVAVGVEVPVQQVAAVPEAAGHRGKQIVSALKAGQRGVGGLPEAEAAAVFDHVLVSVAEIQWVAVGLIHGMPPVVVIGRGTGDQRVFAPNCRNIF